MIRFLRLFAVLIVFLVLGQANAADKYANIEQFAASVQQTLDRKSDSADTVPRPGMPDPTRLLLGQLRIAMASGNPSGIETALTGLSSCLASEQLRKQCEELAAGIQKELEVQQKKAREEAGALMKNAADTVRKATKPADLDIVLAQLRKAGELWQTTQYMNGMAFGQNKIQPAIEFVCRWQDYLFHLANGDSHAAADSLNVLLRDNMIQVDFVPRSEILAHTRELAENQRPGKQGTSSANNGQQPPLVVKKPLHLEPGGSVIDFKVNKLEELDEVLRSLEELKQKREFHDFHGSIDGLLRAFGPLNRNYKEFKAGLPTNIEIPVTIQDSGTLQGELMNLRAELILLVLPLYLGLPPQTKPHPGEGSYDFLNRLANESASKGDYLLAARAREAIRLLCEGTNTGSNDRNQASLFVAGHNQEDAGQFALAVVSYEKALATGSRLVPAKVIGERLDSIQSQHPAEYQKGYELYITPPMPAYASQSGFPPGMRAFQQPAMPPQPQVPEVPRLSVPPANLETSQPAKSPSK